MTNMAPPGESKKRFLQIHRFPALRVTRKEDWGWVLGTCVLLHDNTESNLLC